MIAPTAAPELATPFRNARSLGGYHSDVAREAAMKLPGSPMPSRTRNAPSPPAVRANACSMLLIDHQVMKAARASRVPQRSTRIPETTYMIVYA